MVNIFLLCTKLDISFHLNSSTVFASELITKIPRMHLELKDEYLLEDYYEDLHSQSDIMSDVKISARETLLEI